MHSQSLNIAQILKLLPNRYPFLMVDRVVDYKNKEWLIAIKNVTINEPYFTGHFPNRPVMPGVMIIETLAQAAGLLVYQESENLSMRFVLAGVDQARFKRIVEPGDQLILEVTVERLRKSLWKFSTVAKVGDAIATSAKILLATGVPPE